MRTKLPFTPQERKLIRDTGRAIAKIISEFNDEPAELTRQPIASRGTWFSLQIEVKRNHYWTSACYPCAQALLKLSGMSDLQKRIYAQKLYEQMNHNTTNIMNAWNDSFGQDSPANRLERMLEL